ncbi:MAG: hypothetical protein AAGE76_08620 [Pseudomonadota bacterium]
MSGILGMVLFLILLVPPYWQLWKRTGHSGWISLLMILPIVNLILIWVLAFKRWPALDSNIPERFE